MKSRNLTLMLAAALTVSLAGAMPGFAASDQSESTKKVTRHQRVPVSPAEPRYSGRVPNSCDYDRAAGRCVIDLGYGRCMECNAGPMK